MVLSAARRSIRRSAPTYGAAQRVDGVGGAAFVGDDLMRAGAISTDFCGQGQRLILLLVCRPLRPAQHGGKCLIVTHARYCCPAAAP